MQASSKSFHVDAAAHLIVLVGEVGDFGDGLAVDEHFGVVVEQHDGDVRLALGFAVLRQRGVDAADGVGLKPAHRTAAVDDEYQFGQSLFHDASFLLFLDTG